MNITFNQKVVLVTGSSRGIGAATALKFAGAGAKVVVHYAGNEACAGETLSKLPGDGHSKVQADLSKPHEVKRLFEQVIRDYGRIDILVNNAGTTRDTLLMRMTEEDWDAVLDINLKGTFNCTKAVIRHMSKQRSGKIVNIASVVGEMGNAGQANYSASKAGVIGLTKTIAREFARFQITSNCVCPGPTVTPMTIPEYWSSDG